MSNVNELDKYLIIVSKKLPLTEEKEAWIKENFEFVPYTDEDGKSFLESETYKAYISLVKLMKEKYHINVDSHSAGRTIERQEKVYNDMLLKHGKEWVEKHVAVPGESEHHTGLAVDLRFKHVFVPEFLRSKAYSLAGKTGIKKKIFQIIEKEAIQFGLIKRYPSGKEAETGINEEFWHFRYVGIEHAKAMYESKMCLEEYVKDLKLKSENQKAKVLQ